MLTQVFLPSPKAKNIAMLIFSLVFYSWAGPRYLLLLLGLVFVCWLGALCIQISDIPRQRRLLLWATVGLCLLVLGLFKYLGFFLGNIRSLFGVPEKIPNIVLPIGISFYTFQLISYVVDVYRGDAQAQKKYWMLLLYASLFHQCIAGPIVRYRDVIEDLQARKTKPGEISAGISRFTVGLAKKAVLANGCAVLADQLLVFDQKALAETPALGIILGVMAFTMQIYLDFSAYSDMAIGMGLMCGLHYRENFDYPYMSGSITEFWRRWHISLSFFFRDYVYIPLGGSRCGMGRQLLNLLIVWFLTGMWHGASWNFILWGLYFGFLIAVERYVLGKRQQTLPQVLRHGIVLLLVMFSWILFKFTDFSLLGTALKGLVCLNGNRFSSASVSLLWRNNVFFLLFSAIACTPLGRTLRQGLHRKAKKGSFFAWIESAWEVLHPAALLILSAMALAGDSYNPFIYTQF